MSIAPVQGAADPLAQAREAFRQAYARVDTAREPAPDGEMLRSYPLYPYLEAARIRRVLADIAATPGKVPEGAPGAVDERAASFLARHGGEPVATSLRGVWLTSLAERRQWTEFLKHAEAGQGEGLTDNALECHALHARVALRRTEGLVPLIAARWLTPRSIPDCQVPFDWLRDQGELTAELIEQRVKLALRENNPGFARQIMASLPEQRAAPLRQWAALLQNPRDQIDALIAAPGREVDAEGLLAGWSRLARSDRDAAIARYEALVRARNLTPSSASRYALALALPLSWDRRAESLDYFQRVQPADLDDAGLEWQARAALWAQDWPLVARSIAAMSDEQRGLARWRYWAGRAAEQARDTGLARQLYQSVLPDDNFYSMMAAARLDQALTPHPEKLVRDDVRLRQIERQPAFLRSRELLRLDMRGHARAEWNYGLGVLPDETRPQTIHLAMRWGWYDQAVATATQHRVFNDYEVLYPRPYDAEVAAAARLSGVPGELVYGVMRQESLYRSDAVSSAGARGLMQMLPETARRTARQWKRPTPQIQDLFDPRTNVLLGAAHLRELIDRFNGQTVVALAGYNAGPGASARWLPARSIESDIWIENIPYNETRNYVQRILWHHLVFSWLKTGEPQKTSVWLANVMPRAEEQQALGRASQAEWRTPTG